MTRHGAGRLAWLALPALVGLLGLGATGCGDDAEPTVRTSPPAVLPGAEVGLAAEQQLEAENPTMAVGTVTCPDLPWRVDAEVRCLKVSELSEGRRVKVPGTVSVTSTEGNGTLHVALDDRALEFGVAGEHLGDQVLSWLAGQAVAVREVACPYLPGSVGTRVRCTAGSEEPDGEVGVLVRVTGVDPEEYRTRYAFSRDVGAP